MSSSRWNEHGPQGDFGSTHRKEGPDGYLVPSGELENEDLPGPPCPYANLAHLPSVTLVCSSTPTPPQQSVGGTQISGTEPPHQGRSDIDGNLWDLDPRSQRCRSDSPPSMDRWHLRGSRRHLGECRQQMVTDPASCQRSPPTDLYSSSFQSRCPTTSGESPTHRWFLRAPEIPKMREMLPKKWLPENDPICAFVNKDFHHEPDDLWDSFRITTEDYHNFMKSYNDTTSKSLPPSSTPRRHRRLSENDSKVAHDPPIARDRFPEDDVLTRVDTTKNASLQSPHHPEVTTETVISDVVASRPKEKQNHQQPAPNDPGMREIKDLEVSGSPSSPPTAPADQGGPPPQIGDCVVCMDAKANQVFVPCGHLATCGPCAKSLDKCPVCRRPIDHRQELFLVH